MSSFILARRDRKLAAFRDAVQGRLGADIVEIINRLVSTMTVRVQPEPLLEDHSLALSAPITGRENFHIGLFRTTDTLFGTRPRFVWGGFIPAGEQAHVLYTTGHGFAISITRVGREMVTVSAKRSQGANNNNYFFDGDEDTLVCFNGKIFLHCTSKRVDVYDQFYVILERIR